MNKSLVHEIWRGYSVPNAVSVTFSLSGPDIFQRGCVAFPAASHDPAEYPFHLKVHPRLKRLVSSGLEAATLDTLEAKLVTCLLGALALALLGLLLALLP